MSEQASGTFVRPLRDPYVATLAALYAALVVAYLVLDDAALYWIGEFLGDLTLLTVVAVACLHNAVRGPLRERPFWILVSAWVVTWMIARLYTLTLTRLERPWTATDQATTDLLYVISYVLLLTSSTALAAPEEGGGRARFRRQLAERGAMVVLALGLIVYLLVVPREISDAAYIVGAPSSTLYAALDIVVAVVFLRLAWLRRPSRPRYVLLSAGMLWIFVCDVYEAALLAEVLPYPAPGAAIDFLWYVSPGFLLLAARHPYRGSAEDLLASGDAEPGSRRALTAPPPALYAGVVLLIHFLGDFAGIWNEDTASARGTVAFWMMLTLLVLDWLRQRELENERSAIHRRQLESESRYRLLFDDSLTANYVSRPDGTIVTCNESFARLFGFASPAATRGAHAQQLYLHDEDRQRFLETMRSEHKVVAHEWDMQTLDGRPLRVLENAVGVYDDETLEEIHGQLVDVTGHRELEEQLRHAVKLEAVGQLAGGMAHDFNNVLTAVQGYAQLIEQQPEDADQVGADASRIRAIVAGASDVTQQLLAFSRRQPLRPEVLHVNDIVEAVGAMVGRLIGEHIRLELRLEPSLPCVSADRAQLERVLVNLVVNARDAMPGGGQMVIETEPTRSTGPGDPGWVVIHVTDDGRGMGAEELEHAFEPFFTTKERGRGTGLGLSTVYGIVQLHGGEVDVASSPGQGTRVTILLPGTSESPEAVGALTPVPDRGRETILVVEDEDSVREVAVRSLESRGYRVLSAAGPAEAERTFAEEATGVDLLLTDVVMPGMSGVDLFRRLAPLAPELRVLYMSGYVDTALLAGYVPEDLSPLLAKPFGIRDVAAAVREALDA